MFDRGKKRDHKSPQKKPKDQATGIDFSRLAMPVFDEFREVFIVTEGKESFYMDIEGNYDQSLGHQI